MATAEPRPSAASSTSSSLSYADEAPAEPMIPRPAAPQTLTLIQPSRNHRRRPSSTRVLRLFRSLCRTLPIFTPKCKLAAGPCKLSTSPLSDSSFPAATSRRTLSGDRVTGTLFGYRKGRVSLCVQESPRCLPSLIVELALQTHVLMRELSSGMVRIALECEKRPDRERSGKLLEEPLWSMFCNGKKTGYGVKREASEEDLGVMEVLRAVSMGAGVLPGRSEVDGPEGEMAYMRANFEHVVGSRDSETLYMLGPDGNNGPELTIFFVRI